MLYFSFWASLILAILRVSEHGFKAIRGANLEFRFTKEIFVRAFNLGECWFCNCVLVSNETPSIIESIDATLEKTDNASKKFPLSLVVQGEKYRGNNGLQNFYFHSTSPISIIPTNNPQRILYLFSNASYASQIRKVYDDFRLFLLQRSNSLKESIETETESRQILINKILQEIIAEVNRVGNQIIQLIQVEPGKYTISISVRYKQKDPFTPFFKTKDCSSKLTFEIDSNVREIFFQQIKNSLLDFAENSLFKKELCVPVPEYHPVLVQEVND